MSQSTNCSVPSPILKCAGRRNGGRDGRSGTRQALHNGPLPSDPMDLVSEFRGAMRRLASGVGILTANGPSGPTGMAATSITSLTIDPSTILFCINRTASLHVHLTQGRRPCVNLLAHDQREISMAFSGSIARERRFEVGSWTPDPAGVPQLENAQANISCSIDRLIPYHSHTLPT